MLVQIGACSLPALLPSYIAKWGLTKTQAGWLIGIIFASYVVAVPILVALTDRVLNRNIHVVGAGLTAIAHLGFAVVADGFWLALVFRALAGIGWAGAYMPGLKAITEHLAGNSQSHAVSLHAAGVGVACASSFAIAGIIGELFGTRAPFVLGGSAAVVALLIAVLVMPSKRTSHAPERNLRVLLDFSPVFRNRKAMAWIAGYTFHTWEMAGLRAWGVTFLSLSAQPALVWLPSPATLFTVAGFVGIAVSFAGNELAQRFGRLRVVTWAMSAAAPLAICTGWMVGSSLMLAAVLVIVWLALIFLDSSALTAGTVQAADPSLRGVTMGLHSMCGYAGGFLGRSVSGLPLMLPKPAPRSLGGLGLANWPSSDWPGYSSFVS